MEHQNSDNEDQGGSKNTHISIEKENGMSFFSLKCGGLPFDFFLAHIWA